MAFRALRSLRAAGTTDGVAVAIQAPVLKYRPRSFEGSRTSCLRRPVDATRFLSAL